jgi:hypothetical protein
MHHYKIYISKKHLKSTNVSAQRFLHKKTVGNKQGKPKEIINQSKDSINIKIESTLTIKYESYKKSWSVISSNIIIFVSSFSIIDCTVLQRIEKWDSRYI